MSSPPHFDANIPGQTDRGCFSLSKNPFGLFRHFLQSAARIICSLLANKFYTRSLSGVFAHVRAAVENDLTLFSAYAENSAKLF